MKVILRNLQANYFSLGDDQNIVKDFPLIITRQIKVDKRVGWLDHIFILVHNQFSLSLSLKKNLDFLI